VAKAQAVTALGWLEEPRSDAGVHFLEDDGTWRYTSYEDLAGRVAAMAEILRGQGLERQRLGVIGTTSEDFVVQHFATLATGGTCVPIPSFLAGQDRVGHDLRVAGVLETARPHRVMNTDGSDTFAGWPATTVPAYVDLSPVGQVRITASDAPAIVQFSSGSTGAPKGVRMSRARLDGGLTSFKEWMGITGADRWATWLPFWLLWNLNRPVATQCDTVCMTPLQFSQRPDRWLRCMGELGCTVTSAASFGYHHVVQKVRPETLAGCRLDGWRIAGIFGEPLRAADLDEFVAAFGSLGFRRRAFCPIYGMTEASRMIAATRPEEEPTARADDGGRARPGDGSVLAEVAHQAAGGDRLVAVGRPTDGVRLAIRLADGGIAPEGALGEVLLGGDAPADGYDGGDDFGEWVATGDVGCIRDGELFLFGRLTDNFVIRGKVITAPLAEQAITRCLPHAAAVVVVPNRATGPGITVVVAPGAPWSHEQTDQARAAVCDLFRQTEVDLLVVAPGDIPRSASGKPRRQEVWARYVSRTPERLP
jgi:acyl-CoA synthetase (AMP-forming)/AMP-acid ligase II